MNDFSYRKIKSHRYEGTHILSCIENRFEHLMDMRIIYLLFLLNLVSCNPPSEDSGHKQKDPSQKNVQVDSVLTDTSNLNDKSQNEYFEDTCSVYWTSKFEDYNSLKSYTNTLKKQLHKRYITLRGEEAHLFLDSVGYIYGQLLAKEFIPHWLGTGWTYNGHTDTPKEGTVACGYLVSTIFKHSGINVNRYKLAQQAASNGAKTILGSNRAPKFVRYEQIFEHLEGLPDGLYKLGLNNHTGFLWLENGQAYFLHSTFINYEGVKIEKAACSLAFNYSTIFQIVPISSNHFLLKKWLSGNAVQVITG